jgi:tetratricopeptide (TPR) repeat protein
LRRALPALAISLVTALCLFPGVFGAFLTWDDQSNFTRNPDFRGLSWAHLRWMWTTFHMGHYQPLAWMTLGLDYELWGMNPAGYHVTSLLLHCISAGLFFTVLKALVDSPKAAAVGALFWSIHPLRVESVSWITERRDVLCGVFFLLSILAYLRMCRERDAGGSGTRWLVLSVVAYVASLLSKSLGIMLPLALLLLDVVVLRRFVPGKRRRVILEKGPYLACAAAVFIVMIAAMQDVGEVRKTLAPLERVAQASFGVCLYAWKTLLPWHLSPLYPIDRGIDPSQSKFVVSMIVAPLLTAGLAVLARTRPAPFAAWLAFLILVAPVLGFVVRGYQLAADRYTYLSTLPFSLLLAAAVRRPLEGPSPRVMLAAAGVVLAVLGTLAAIQTRIWRDDIALWNHAIDSGWGGEVAYTNRASKIAPKGDLAGAMADLDLAVRYNPNHWICWEARGEVCELQGDWERAAENYGRAIECDPRKPVPYEHRAALRARRGDTAGALADYGEAIRRFPGSAGSWIERGKLKGRLEDRKGAIADLDEGLMRNPLDAAGFYLRGQCHYALGDLDGAFRDFTAAIRLDPTLRDAHLNRGAILGLRKKFAEAIGEFSAELRLDPKSLDALRNRGIAARAVGLREQATADFERLLRIAPPDWHGRVEIAGFLAELRNTK